ncbi:MAG TPA: HAD family hydrolase, partial [Geobacterales bacterium]|nr:HAD family hydrolase [Geobacterales bacterium]
PEWKDKEPFMAVLEGDLKALAASGEKGLVQLLMETHAGMTTEQFTQIVKDWLATARHPRFDRPYTELVYQPMIELLAYMRANGFKTFIVSGGGIEFMRPWTEQIYGVPPEQVVGSSIKTKFQFKDGIPELFRLPDVHFIDDRPASRSASTSTSGGARSPHSAIPMAILRCSNGPLWQAAAVSG